MGSLSAWIDHSHRPLLNQKTLVPALGTLRTVTQQLYSLCSAPFDYMPSRPIRCPLPDVSRLPNVPIRSLKHQPPKTHTTCSPLLSHSGSLQLIIQCAFPLHLSEPTRFWGTLFRLKGVRSHSVWRGRLRRQGSLVGTALLVLHLESVELLAPYKRPLGEANGSGR